MKNDFIIWGERITMTGVKIPIHLRYAIDTPPKQYTSILVDCETDENNPITGDRKSVV